MKKFLTFAITALLLGGFVFNADAQTPIRGKSKSKKNTVILNNNSKVSTKTPSQMIKDYEDAVEQCLVLFNAIQNKSETVKANSTEFNKALRNAETQRDNINKIKSSLSRSLTNRFDVANKKLASVYK